MFETIRSRLILIAILLLGSLWAIRPRNIPRLVTAEDGTTRTDSVSVWGPKLGLDLQGGIHLGLELDQSKVVSADPARDIELALTILRKRIDEFGVAEPVVQRSGADRIVVELAGETDPARAKSVVQRAAFLEFRITDETQALERALPALDRAVHALGITATAVGAAPTAPSAVTQLLGGDTTRVDSTVPGGGVLSALIRPAGGASFQPMPGEYMVPVGAADRVDSLLSLPSVAREFPRGLTWRWDPDTISIGVEPFRLLYVLADEAIMDGTHLENAQAAIDPLSSAPIVNFQLDRRGGREFYRHTSTHVGDYMAILLDGRVQGRPPVINDPIERRGQITLGGKTMQEAQDLALSLNAGALPIPLKIVEQYQVDATLGADGIRAGFIAGLIGTAFVVLLMVGYYRMAGVLAVVALGMYVIFSLAGLVLVDATLTLPGLAGLVLSIGIAVDANVLIFERIREELAAGRALRVAVEEGFKNAMSAIIDSNVTTALTALFLFQFGTGPVQGFAVMLILGIIASMVTAIFVTRTLFMIWIRGKSSDATLSI
jgi:preprotein translocase subunit SecD